MSHRKQIKLFYMPKCICGLLTRQSSLLKDVQLMFSEADDPLNGVQKQSYTSPCGWIGYFFPILNTFSTA
jgi:hypothetical protein